MSTLTKQGLRASLYAALELGFKSHESGHNWERTIFEAHEAIDRLTLDADNCPNEVFRIKLRKGERVKK